MFDTARAYGDNEQLARPGARGRRCRASAHRDEGRHGAVGRRLGARRQSAVDPSGLRGEPRGARRPADRPLPPPRARSADAVADVRASAREARRRGPRRAGRRLQRQPHAARRGARARADLGRAGRPQQFSTTRRFAAGSSSAAAELGHRARSPTRRSAGHVAQAARSKDAALAEIARAHDATEAEVALAWVLDLAPNVVAIPGARRPETARSAARAAALELDEDERERGSRSRPSTARRRRRDGDVVVVMGIPGAGKSRIAERVRRAGLPPPQPRRARRDAPASSSGALDEALDDRRPQGRPRQHVPHARLAQATSSRPAARHGAARPLRLARHAARAGAGEPRRAPARPLRAAAPPGGAESRELASDPGVLTPTQQMRALRELEPPARGRGLRARGARAVLAGTARGTAGRLRRRGRGRRLHLDERSTEPASPHLVFDWQPDGPVADLERAATVARLPVGDRRDGAVHARRRAADPAGADRRSPDYLSRSRAGTASTLRARSSSARARRTARSRTPSARATSRPGRGRSTCVTSRTAEPACVLLAPASALFARADENRFDRFGGGCVKPMPSAGALAHGNQPSSYAVRSSGPKRA